MNIRDYLHLFLGCKVRVTGWQYNSKLVEIRQDGILVKDTFETKINYGDFKIILRPLSEMTEEEALHCHLLDHPLDKNGLGGAQVIEFYRDNPFATPEPFRYLLSKHFDLFDLHKAGLCYYKNEKGELY